VRNKLKIALIALVLSISALALAGWGQMDIQKMKRAIASSKEINTLISQQKIFARQISEANEKLNFVVTKIGVLDLIEYDLCSLRKKKVLPQGFLGVELADLPGRKGILIKKLYPNCPDHLPKCANYKSFWLRIASRRPGLQERRNFFLCPQ